MKLNRFTIALLAFCASGAFLHAQAQTPAPPAPPSQSFTNDTETPVPAPDNGRSEDGARNGDRLAGLANALGLTEEQRTQVQTIFDDMRQKIETAVEEARTQANTDLQKILSADQYQKLQGMMESHERHWKHRHGQQERPERTPPNQDENATPNP